MRLLEFEAKNILKKYGIALPAGQVVSMADEFNFTAPAMIKSQVPIGGRGKTGGVVAADTAERAQTQIAALFEKEIRGYRAQKILVEPIKHK